ncbi:MAG: DUF192 domain-containing protein [Candidatus Woesearchaeota archaeon]
MILNKTKNKTISKKEIICKSLFSQGIGLMFHRRQNLIMIFPKERTVQLHNFFVFYSIDVLLLDEKMRIVEIKRNFRPFTCWNSQQKGKYLLELAFFGECARGDVLEINLIFH